MAEIPLADKGMDRDEPPKPGGPPIEGAARATAVSPGVIAQVAGKIRSWLAMGAAAQRDLMSQGQPGATMVEGRPVAPSQVVRTPGGNGDVWMGPGDATQPTAPYKDVAGRAFDYVPGYNLTTGRQRASEGIGFEQLRALADNCDLLRLAIETRKDQLCKVAWSIMPKKKANDRIRAKADARCEAVEKFFRKPDGVHPWDIWLRELLEDVFVIDAQALYRRRDRAGRPYALEVMDGSGIKPLLDAAGRRPIHPAPAYQHVLKGMEAAEYTTNELTYSIRNPRSWKVYGYSQVEQVLMTVNICIRRALGQLHHFTEGNIPDAFVAMPPEWNTTQIQEFQRYFDTMMADPGARRRARFVPTGVAPMMLRPDGQLTDQFDEWLVRIIMYCFSLPPFPFVRQQNRATAETSYDSALEEGLAPLMTYVKGIIDNEIAEFFGFEDLELVWDDLRKLDPTEQSAQDQTDIRSGIQSLDDVRASRGLEPYGLPAIIFGIGPLGWMTIESVKKCIAQGLDMPPAQTPMDGMGLPPGADPLAGAPPELLAQLGIDPAQAGARGGAQGSGGAEGPSPEDGEEEVGGPSASPSTSGLPQGGLARPAPMGLPPAIKSGMPMTVARPTAGDLAALRNARVDPRAANVLRQARQRMH